MEHLAYQDQYDILKEFATSWPHSSYLAHPKQDAQQQVLLKTFPLHSRQKREYAYTQANHQNALDYPSIVPLLDYDYQRELFYVVRPYFPSGSLRTLLTLLGSQRLKLAESLHILIRIGEALDFAHQQGVLHQRLSANNILIDDDGEVLLADFTVTESPPLNQLSYQHNTFLFSYMAPEQLHGTVDEQSDQYALGCLGYELICGRLPFDDLDLEGMMHAHQTQEILPFSRVDPTLPIDLNRIILKTLAYSPSERYPNVASLVNDLRLFRENFDADASAVIPATPPSASYGYIETEASADDFAYQDDAQKIGANYSDQYDDQWGNPFVDPSLPEHDLPADDQWDNPYTGPSFPENTPSTDDRWDNNPFIDPSLSEHNPATNAASEYMENADLSYENTSLPPLYSYEDAPRTPSAYTSAPNQIYDLVPPPEIMPPPTPQSSLQPPSMLPPQEQDNNRRQRKQNKSSSNKNRRTPLVAIVVTIAILLIIGSLFTPIIRNTTSNPTQTHIATTPSTTTQQPTQPVPTYQAQPGKTSTPQKTATAAPKSTPKPGGTAKPSQTPTSSPSLTPTEIYSLAMNSKVLATLTTFQVQATESETFVMALVPNITVTDFAFQVALTTQGDSGGLVFRVGTTQNDRLDIGTDGTYTLANAKETIASGKSTAIITGENQTNQVTVVVKGVDIYIYINQQFIAHVKDQTTTPSGGVGCMAVDVTQTTTVSCASGKIMAIPASTTF